MGIGDDERNLENMDIAVCHRKGKFSISNSFRYWFCCYRFWNHVETLPDWEHPQSTSCSSRTNTTDLLWCGLHERLHLVSVPATSQTNLNVGPGPQSASLSFLLSWRNEPVNVSFIKGIKSIFNYLSPILPSSMDKIWMSPLRRNFTEIVNDIMFSGGGSSSSNILKNQISWVIFILINLF